MHCKLIDLTGYRLKNVFGLRTTTLKVLKKSKNIQLSSKCGQLTHSGNIMGTEAGVTKNGTVRKAGDSAFFILRSMYEKRVRTIYNTTGRS